MAEADQLILRCHADPGAFRELVDLFQARIFSFLCRFVGRQDAEDLFQEVWLRAYQAAPRYEARGKAASWLFKIANNTALKHLGKRGREKTTAVGDALDSAPSHAPGPAKKAEQAETRRRVDEAVAALPVEQRQVFLMREYGGMPFKDIAASLDIPLGTALSRMNAALGKLRAGLGGPHA